MNDALFRTFAEENGLSFRWQTRMEGDRAFAWLEVWEDGAEVYSAGTNRQTNEQDVLDIVMTWAIENITAPPVRYEISGWRHSASSRSDTPDRQLPPPEPQQP